MFSFQKNVWNSVLNLNFENLDFLLLSLSKFGHFTTMLHKFQKVRPVSKSVFTQKFNFDSLNVIASFLDMSIYSASEAWLSWITQYWKKWFRFRYFLPKGLSNFVCTVLKFHALKYHNFRHTNESNHSLIIQQMKNVKEHLNSVITTNTTLMKMKMSAMKRLLP